MFCTSGVWLFFFFCLHVVDRVRAPNGFQNEEFACFVKCTVNFAEVLPLKKINKNKCWVMLSELAWKATVQRSGSKENEFKDKHSDSVTCVIGESGCHRFRTAVGLRNTCTGGGRGRVVTGLSRPPVTNTFSHCFHRPQMCACACCLLPFTRSYLMTGAPYHSNENHITY